MASSPPHRKLKVTSPYIKGEDVRALQKGLNYLGEHRSFPSIDVDGEFGSQTLSLARDIAYLIGLHRHHIHGTVSVYTQKRIINPHERTVTEQRRADRRWKRWQKKATLSERAYRTARALVGVMEQGGNNVGPMVSVIIRENSGALGEPWCGDFVAYCYRHAGSKRVSRSWASVRLLRGLTGIFATSRPVRGDLVRYTFDHVGMFVRDLGNGEIETIEGNTGSSGAVSDSSTGGDGVYIKRRSKSLVRDYLHVTG